MTKDQLSYVRIIVPGALTVLLYFTLEAEEFSEKGIRAIDLTMGSRAFLAIIVFGVLYRIFHVRKLVLEKHWRRIRDNVKDRLLSLLPPGALAPGDAALLRKGNRLMDLFYSIVDKDETLKLRRDGVYENGAFVTSIADVIIFAAAGTLLHVAFGIATRHTHHFQWAVGFLVVCLISYFVLLPRVLATHLRLSNEQLDFVAHHHRPAVQSQLIPPQ